MFSSTTALLWPQKPVAKTEPPSYQSHRKPPQSASYLRSLHGLISDRDIKSNPQDSTFPVEPLKFGAFRSEELAVNAERARTLAMMHHPEQFKLLPLNVAADLWLEEKKLHIKKPRTLEAYNLYIRNLKKQLGPELLCALHIGHILTYQQTRRGEGACASYVNHETNTLSQILKRADLWDLIVKHYKPLPCGNWTPPKVLTAEEEERFFRVVACNPDWEVAYWACSVTNNTSAYGTELRNLQFKHIFLDHKPPKIHIPDLKVKNEFRARVIPLNETAETQMKRIVERARGFGGGRPEHYIFPFRVNRGTWDVTRPASRAFIKKTFDKMREVTGLDWLQPRNFRNQLITKLFEGGTPDETITSIAGHQSIRMSQFYSRIRIDRKMEALSAIVPKKKDVQNAG